MGDGCGRETSTGWSGDDGLAKGWAEDGLWDADREGPASGWKGWGQQREVRGKAGGETHRGTRLTDALLRDLVVEEVNTEEKDEPEQQDDERDASDSAGEGDRR